MVTNLHISQSNKHPTGPMSAKNQPLIPISTPRSWRMFSEKKGSSTAKYKHIWAVRIALCIWMLLSKPCQIGRLNDREE